MQVKSVIQGLPELERAFKALPERVAVGAASKAVKAAGEVIANVAKSLVPVDTGNLKRTIGVKVLNKKRGPYQVAAIIGPRVGLKSLKPKKNKSKNHRKSGDGFYGYFVEYGTGGQLSHERKKPISSSKRKKYAESHGGMRPRPFMRPAFDQASGAAEKVMVDILKKEIEKAAQELGR